MGRKILIKESDLRNIVKDAIREHTGQAYQDYQRQCLVEEKTRELKNHIREVAELARTPKEDVMSLYYGIRSNHYRPIRLDEKINLDRIINKHGDNGYVSVSANREYRSAEENVEETKRLLNDIIRSGFSYLPAYGGYRDIKTGEESDFEPSFLIFNYSNTGEKRDFEDLRNFAIELCGKYDQGSVMIKPPGNPPYYVDRDGNKVSKRSSNKVWKNDPTKEYFTQLNPKKVIPQHVQKKMRGYSDDKLRRVKNFYGAPSRRFTNDISFDDDEPKENGQEENTNESRKVFQIYLNPGPQQLSERMQRVGEVMIWDVF